MKIDWYERDVYGQSLRYVEDAYIAGKLGRLIGTKTVSEGQMASISELFGVEWEQVLAPKKD